MNRSFCRFRNPAGALFLVLFSVIASTPALAQQDITAPTMSAFTFSPTAVNTTTSSATITATTQFSDNLSGVAGSLIRFLSPSGQQVTECNPRLISGSDLNGTYQCTLYLPPYSEAGSWFVQQVSVTDNVGNISYYYTSDLQALSFPTTLQVTSHQDITAPTMNAFTFSPMAVNTTTSSATFTATAQFTDDLSGVAGSLIRFLSPSSQQSTECNPRLISSTDLNGTFQCTLYLPPYSEAGTWIVQQVSVSDNVGNYRFYYTSDLQALSFPTTLQVTSQQDITAPTMSAFTFTPMAVNTTTSSATITATVQFSDNLSGVGGSLLRFVSPSGQQSAECNLRLISGNDLNGTYQCTIPFPAYSEVGTWVVQQVLVIDNVGNFRYYYTSDLLYLGFPAAVVVDVPSAIALSTSQIRTTASGLVYSRVSKAFTGSVTIKNITTTTINGPFQILFTALPIAVTLAHTAGTFNGSPFIMVPSVVSLAPGQTATVIVQFEAAPTSKVTFTPVVYSGSL